MKPARRLLIPALLVASVLMLSISTVPAGDGKTRVYVTDSQSWELHGQAGGGAAAAAGSIAGGARPQTAEIIKTFGERCPAVTVTLNKENADYVILLDHEGGKQLVLRDNKVAVFAKDGDVIYSGSTRTLGNAVKNACSAIARNSGVKP